MHNLSKKIAHYFSVESESGVTAIEYGLLASLVALGIIVGATLLGGNLGALFNYIGTQVQPPS